VTRRPRIDLRAEDGFTIVELLTAMVIGAIVLFATLTVLDTTISLTTRVNTRVDTLQRGRNAMDLMIRDLRSQNCVNVLTNAATGATSMGTVNPGDVLPAAITIQSVTIVLTVVPILAVYPFIQRYFVTGVMLGAVKG